MGKQVAAGFLLKEALMKGDETPEAIPVPDGLS